MKSEKRYLFYGIGIMMIICWLVFLTGCGANELENHAFPLALGVEKTSEDDLEIYMAYPDLQDDKAAEMRCPPMCSGMAKGRICLPARNRCQQIAIKMRISIT